MSAPGAPANPLDAVRFDDAGFALVRDEPKLRGWTTPAGDPLLLHYREAPPDIEAPLYDDAKLRAFYARKVEEAGGELVEARRLVIQRCVLVRLVLRADVATVGARYVGSLTLAFRSSSYVLNVVCDGRAGAAEPLARVRETLAHLERTLALDPSLVALPRFIGGP